MKLEHVTPIGRQGHVHERVGAEGVAALVQLAAVGVVKPQRGVEPAVDALGFEVAEHPLPLLPVEREAIDVGRGDDPVDDRVQRHRRRLRG